jgi:hypothetical protein
VEQLGATRASVVELQRGIMLPAPRPVAVAAPAKPRPQKRPSLRSLAAKAPLAAKG